MQFVDLLSEYYRSWWGWFRMVLREGIARDVQERRARATERQRDRMAMLAKRRLAARQQHHSQGGAGSGGAMGDQVEPMAGVGDGEGRRATLPASGPESIALLASLIEGLAEAFSSPAPSTFCTDGPSPPDMIRSPPPSNTAEKSPELIQAESELRNHESELEALNKEKSDIHQFKAGSYDFGPDEIFFPFAGRWAEAMTRLC